MGPELLDELSSSALFRLGRAMTECLSHVVRVLREGKEAGVFAIDDPDQVANTMYALGLGVACSWSGSGSWCARPRRGSPMVEAVAAGTVGAQLVEATVALAHVTNRP